MCEIEKSVIAFAETPIRVGAEMFVYHLSSITGYDLSEIKAATDRLLVKGELRIDSDLNVCRVTDCL